MVSVRVVTDQVRSAADCATSAEETAAGVHPAHAVSVVSRALPGSASGEATARVAGRWGRALEEWTRTARKYSASLRQAAANYDEADEAADLAITRTASAEGTRTSERLISRLGGRGVQ